jgi:hypothetical protein
MNKTIIDDLIEHLNENIVVLNKLNNITYHNLQKAKKVLLNIKENETKDFGKIKEIKLQIYSLELSLEEIVEVIKHYEENKN